MAAPRPAISVIVVAYDTGAPLLRCLESVASGDGGDVELVLVNNGAPAPEIAEARRRRLAEVVSPRRNLGFAAGCNLGAARARADVLVFLNPDTVVAPGTLRALARALADPAVGIAMARLRLLDAPDSLNSAGTVVHLAGFAWPSGYGRPVEEAAERRDVTAASGAAMAIRADVFRELGGFADELFLYLEDVELSWRARLRGLRVVIDPAADVYHDYRYERGAGKRFFLERNRLLFVLSAYPPRLLLAAAPVLAAAELAVVALALREGWAREKAAGWGWCLRNVAWLRRRRRETQRLRRVPERELARLLTPVVDPRMTAVPALVRLLNPALVAYWSLVRRAL